MSLFFLLQRCCFQAFCPFYELQSIVAIHNEVQNIQNKKQKVKNNAHNGNKIYKIRGTVGLEYQRRNYSNYAYK